MKSFIIEVEYPDKYEDADVLENIMSNIDIDEYESIGVKFKVNHCLKVAIDKYRKNKGL